MILIFEDTYESSLTLSARVENTQKCVSRVGFVVGDGICGGSDRRQSIFV